MVAPYLIRQTRGHAPFAAAAISSQRFARLPCVLLDKADADTVNLVNRPLMWYPSSPQISNAASKSVTIPWAKGAGCT